MTVCRYYLMTAKDDKVEDLREALVTLIKKVEVLPGFERLELYQEPEAPARFHLHERWVSIEAYTASNEALGEAAFTSIFAALAETPVGIYLDIIPT